MSENKNNKLTAILILLILLLGSGLVYLLLQHKELKTEYVVLEEKNTTVEDLYAELEKEYDKSLAQLENLEGENASLDSLLNLKKQELQENKAYIASLISNKNASEKQLADARKLIQQLTNQRISLQNAVDSLKERNIALEEANIILIQEKDIIQTSLDEATVNIGELETVKSALEEEKSKASILTAKNVSATGIRLKGSGKEIETTKASSVKKLKLCFDLLENKIAPEGPTRVLIRIISPGGTTLALQSIGSGVFTNTETGEEMQYTYEIMPDFKRDGKSVCSYWDQNVAYPSGKYRVEIYQRGYPIGSTNFELK